MMDPSIPHFGRQVHDIVLLRSTRDLYGCMRIEKHQIGQNADNFEWKYNDGNAADRHYYACWMVERMTRRVEKGLLALADDAARK